MIENGLDELDFPARHGFGEEFVCFKFHGTLRQTPQRLAEFPVLFGLFCHQREDIGASS